MDVSTAIQAKSDQLNAIDLTGGPVTVRILEVREGNADQPVKIITDMFGPSRPFKPSKTVLRVLVAGWNTTDTTAWVGRSVTLYRDPAVRWAGEQVGGIRVSAMSHLDKPLALMLPTSKGKTAKSTIQVLPNAPASAQPTDWLSELATAGNDPAALNALGHAAKNAGAGEDVLGQIRAALVAAKEASA